MENHDDSSANRRQQSGRTSLPQAASLQRAFQYYLAATHFASQPYPFGSRWTACPSSYQLQQQPPTPPLFSQTLVSGSGHGAAGVGEGSASHALPVSSQLQIIPGSSPSYYYQPQVQPTPPLFYQTLGSGSGDGAGGVGGGISSGSPSSYPYQPPQPSPMFSQTHVSGAGAGVAGSAPYHASPAMFQANLSSSYQYQQQQPPPPPLLSQTLGSGGGAGAGGFGGSWTSHASPMLSRTIVSGSSSTYQCQPSSSSLLDPAFGSTGGFGSVGESSASRNISRFWWEAGASSNQYQAPTPSLLDQSYGWSGDVGSVGGNSASDPGPSSQWQGIPSGSSDYAMSLPSLDPTSSNGVIGSGNFPCSRPATFLLSLDTGLHSVMWPRAGTTAPPTSAVDQPSSSSALLPHGRLSTASVFAMTTHEGALPSSPLPPPSQTATVQPEDTVVHAALEQELSVDDYDLMPFVDNPVMDTTAQLHEPIGAAPEPADTSDDDDDDYAAIFYGEMNSSGDEDADINSSTTAAESSASVPSEVTVKEEPLDWSPAESSSLHIPVEHRVKEEPVDDWSPSGTDTSSPAPAATSSPLPSPAYPMVQVKIEASDWTSETSELGTNAFSSGGRSSSGMQRQQALSETNPLLSSTGLGWGASGARSGRRGRAGRGGDSSSGSFGHDASDPLVVDFADGSFTESETKKITGEKRLAEIVLTNPKRVRSILRNRRGAQTSIDVADTGS